MDELCYYHIVRHVEVVLESQHEVVILVQVHVLVLQSVEPVNHVRATCVDVCL